MFNKIKARLTSKTYIAALTMTALTVIETSSSLISSNVSAEIRPYLLAAWPIIMITLREVTKTPLGGK